MKPESLIKIQCPIEIQLTEPLEDFFCGLESSTWALQHNEDNGLVSLTGYFETKLQAEENWQRLLIAFPDLSDQPTITTLEELDWKESYKKHFQPWHYRGLHWVPTWERENYKISEGDSILYLDPGMAFGTGLHPTTRLCLEPLIEYRDRWRTELSDKVLLDIGCGSGILALSGAVLGFKRVFGFDNDPQAIHVSLINRDYNGLSATVKFEELEIMQALKSRTGDVILANISSGILVKNAETLIRSTQPGGVLILSGLLTSESEMVRDCYHKIIHNFEISYRINTSHMAEWSSIIISCDL